MYLYFVRHGQTDDNFKNIVQGRIDNPLNDIGRSQAKQTGLKLKNMNIKFDHIYSSPLIRAKESASIIAKELNNKDLTVVDGLIEREFGSLEGLDVSYMRYLVQQKDFKAENFESDEEIINRVSNCVSELTKTGENLLLVCHSHTIKAMLIYINKDKYGFDYPLSNAQVVKIKYDGKNYIIEDII